MQAEKTNLDGVFLLKPQVFTDDRGFFLESYNGRALAEAGIEHCFVQDNHSGSKKSVLRGLHYQIHQAQGKLVRVVVGEVFDVAVDLRRDSTTFGKWVGQTLSAQNRHMLWIPPGFAHGFAVLSDWAEVLYKTTDYYAAEWERTIRWNDPDLDIDWPISGPPQLSPKDSRGVSFCDAEIFLKGSL